jgi:hypothetical protein
MWISLPFLRDCLGFIWYSAKYFATIVANKRLSNKIVLPNKTLAFYIKKFGSFSEYENFLYPSTDRTGSFKEEPIFKEVETKLVENFLASLFLGKKMCKEKVPQHGVSNPPLPLPLQEKGKHREIPPPPPTPSYTVG